MSICLKIFIVSFLMVSPLKAKCTFRQDLKKVISLSGPMTVLLKEVGLLDHPALGGISVFNPVSKEQFKKKIYPGGIFLANSTLKEFKDSVVFFDESQQVKNVLKLGEGIISEEIKTRNFVPLEVMKKLGETLRGYTVQCEKELQAFQQKGELIQRELLKKIPHRLEVVFYLGGFKGQRLPETVIVNDGVVKLLILENKIKTYPSELSYVNWSARMMSSFSSKLKHVAVIDSGMKLTQEVKKVSQRVTLIYPGSLVPGLSQLEAFSYLADHL